jgi:DNA-directed RNA polymerase subunit omega
MRKISIDKLIDMVDSRYSLVTIIAKRARQIIEGQEMLIKTDTKKPVCIAIEEFYDNCFEAIYETEQQRQAEIENYERILEQAEREVHLSEE